MLLCGYNGMFPKSTFGQTVALFNIIQGLLVLSLAIEVIFGVLSLNSQEEWAFDWIEEYQIKESEREAATSYLTHWWRYAALSGEDPRKHGLTDDELQEKKTLLYTKAVGQYNRLRHESGKLASIEKYAQDSSATDFETAEADLDTVLGTLPSAVQVANEELTQRIDAIETSQQQIIAQLDQLLAA